MARNSGNRRAFTVVQFIELPFEGIDDYVCVPYTWLVVRRPDKKAAVAYPNDEDPFETRDRVKRIERYNDEWRFYMATVKYESDTYRDAEYWITTRNDNGPLVEKELKADMQPMGTVTMELNSYNQHHLSKSNDTFRKTLPRKSIKRPAQLESKKGIDGKRLKLGEAAQSSNAVVNDAKVDPGSSNNKQSIIIQDNQPVEFAQTEETAAASNSDKNTESRSQSQRIEQKEQGVKKPDQNNKMNQNQFSSNTTASSMTAAKPSTPADQTTQPNQHNNQEHIPDSGSSLSNFRPQIDNVRSLANVHDDHKLLVNEVSSYEPFINHLSRNTIDSLKIPARLYMDGARRLVPIHEPVEIEKRVMLPISRNLAIAAQNPSNLIDQTRSLSTRSVIQLPVVTQNQSQNDEQVQKMHTGNSRDQTASFRITISSQDNQIPRINIERSNDVTAVDPRNVLQSVTNDAATSKQLPSSSHKRPSHVRRSDGHQNSLAHERYFTHSHPNQYVPTNQGNLKQELLRGSIESSSYDHRHIARTIKRRIPSITRQNLTHLSNPMDQTCELPQQRQSQPNQQDSQRQPQRPKIRIGISNKPKDKRQMPTLQGVTKKTQRQALSTTHNNFLLSHKQLQPRLSAQCTEDNNIALTTSPQNIAASATSDKHNSEIDIPSFYQATRNQHTTAHENVYQNLRTQKQFDQFTQTNSTSKCFQFIDDVARSPVTGSHLNVMDNACQTDEYAVKETLSPYHAVTLDSDAVTDHEDISDHEVSTDETPVETSNNFDCTANDFGCSSAVRPTAAQNPMSTNHQTHPRVILEQQMLDNFAILLTQMGSSLRYTCDMYNNIRGSILVIAKTYKQLLGEVKSMRRSLLKKGTLR